MRHATDMALIALPVLKECLIQSSNSSSLAESDFCVCSAGRQRVRVHFDNIAVNDLAKCRVEILPEPGNGPLPREIRAGGAYWPAAALPMFDAADLALQAIILFREFAPGVSIAKFQALQSACAMQSEASSTNVQALLIW